MSAQFPRFLRTLFLVALTACLFTACKKNDSVPAPETPELPDLSTQIRSSASGFVTDENNAPVESASVKLGAVTTTTDADGYFQIRNVDVVKNAAVVTVEKTGYFKGIKTYIAAQGKAGFFRIRLIPKTISGTVSGTSGGDVTLSNGLKVSFPTNAVINASSGSAYTGTVNVASYWIDPTSNTLAAEMPGDLRGLATNGGMQMLTTYGMAAVELTGAGGELLQVASGKKATLTMPVPASINGSAPASIPLWSFDETKGLWKQEGSATKTGNTYVGEVSHFSFWNCDVPSNYVQFNCTVVNSAGNPIPYAAVKISVVGNPNNAAWGYTDSSGYVGGAIPGNASLLLQVFNGYNCGNPVYTQNFTSATSTVALGTITITSTTSIANITGTITNCTGGPVVNGYIRMNQDGQLFRYSVDASGGYSFNALLCSSTSPVEFIAEDLDAMQQSSALPYVLMPGANAIGNLQACGVTTNEFFTYSLDGGPAITYTSPADSVAHSGTGSNNAWYISGSSVTGNTWASVSFSTTGISVGSSQQMTAFNSNLVPQSMYVVTPNTGVTITELGTVGEYVAGTFSGSLSSTSPPTTMTVSGSFRVRRNF